MRLLCTKLFANAKNIAKTSFIKKSVKAGRGIGERNEGNDGNAGNQGGKMWNQCENAGNQGGNVANQGGNLGNVGGNVGNAGNAGN